MTDSHNRWSISRYSRRGYLALMGAFPLISSTVGTARGQESESKSEWGQRERDASHRSFNPTAITPKTELEEWWETSNSISGADVNVEDEATTTFHPDPLVKNSRLYALEGSEVTIRSIGDGSVKKRISVGSEESDFLPAFLDAIGEDTAYVSSRSAGEGATPVHLPVHLHAISLKSGEERWRYTVETSDPPGPYFRINKPFRVSLQDGVLYCVGGAPNTDMVHALNAETGNKRWGFASDDTLFDYGAIGWARNDPPSVSGRTVYANLIKRDTRGENQYGNLYALDADSGSVDWSYKPTERQVSGFVSNSPIVTNSQVGVLTTDNRLYSLTPESGDQNWWANSGDYTAIAGDNDNIFLARSTDGKGELLAINVDNVSWRVSFDGEPRALTITGEAIYLGLNDGRLLVFDHSTGEILNSNSAREVLHNISAISGAIFLNTGSGVSAIVGDVSRPKIPMSIEISNTPQEPLIGQEVTFTVTSVENANGGVEQIEWATSTDGSFNNSGESSSHRFTTGGEQEVQVRITDSAGNTATETAVVTVKDQFSPQIHGFGFRNWATGTDEPIYPGHNHSYVEESEIRRVLKSTLGSEFENTDEVEIDKIPNGILDALVKEAYISLNQGLATNGHCFGMVMAAAKYFQQPNDVPGDRVVASQFQTPAAPDDIEETVGDNIDYYHNTQMLEGAAYWKSMRLRFPRPDLQQEAIEIRNAIESEGIAQVILVNNRTGGGHAVLAYDFQESSESIVFEVYDPTIPSDSESSSNIYLTIDKTNKWRAIGPYPRYAFTPATGSADLPATVTASMDHVVTSAAEGVIGLLTKSPVEINVSPPEGATTFQMQSEYENLDATEYDRSVFVYGASSGTYDIELRGTGTGEYSLEVIGGSKDGGEIHQSQTGQIQEGSIHRYRATVPDSPTKSGSLKPALFNSSIGDQKTASTDGVSEIGFKNRPRSLLPAAAISVGTLTTLQYLRSQSNSDKTEGEN